MELQTLQEAALTDLVFGKIMLELPPGQDVANLRLVCRRTAAALSVNELAISLIGLFHKNQFNVKGFQRFCHYLFSCGQGEFVDEALSYVEKWLPFFAVTRHSAFLQVLEAGTTKGVQILRKRWGTSLSEAEKLRLLESASRKARLNVVRYLCENFDFPAVGKEGRAAYSCGGS